MKCILGKKIEMMQMFSDTGAVVGVTSVKAGPCFVTQVKTMEKDGYTAVQLGFDSKKNLTKAERGRMKNTYPFSDKKGFRYMKEVRAQGEGVELGALVDISNFQKGEEVEVVGWSKGKGFAGVVKRHHFHGHPTSHGHKDQERMPGSIGAGGVQRVFKGKRMAGRMGNDRVTVKGLEIISIDEEKGILYVKGALPGPRNGLVMIQAVGDISYKKYELKTSDDDASIIPPSEGADSQATDREVKEEIGEPDIVSSDDLEREAAQIPGSPQEEVAREDSEDFPPIASEDEPQDAGTDEATGKAGDNQA